MSEDLPFWYPFGRDVGRGPAQARVYNSANLSPNNNTLTALTFNSERYDTGNFHSTSSNNNRLTAPTAGLYLFGVSIRWASNATGYRQLYLRVNGTTGVAAQLWTAVNGEVVDQSVSTIYRLAAGDYVEAMAKQTSGVTLDITATGNHSPEFWIVRLGSQA